jgi:phosphatidylserine/phosphatidylglycerophosphate/cardiolipin synthase-like enzyme
VLAGLIDEARERIFLVSFVAYNVPSIISALNRALHRGVSLDVLLETSTAHGGKVTVDSISLLKSQLAGARFFQWKKAPTDPMSHGSVHGKCAVADGLMAFVTSANLSEAALERNMEIGILVRGGSIPGQLDRHLQALITTKQLKPA